MRIFVYILTSLLITIIVNGMVRCIRQPNYVREGKVYLHKFFPIAGGILSTVFLIPAIIGIFANISMWVIVVSLLVASLSAALIVAYINCRITYDKTGFVTKNFFGIKRTYTYDQVTGIKNNTHETFIYMGERRVMVDEFMIGGLDFLHRVQRKYRDIHPGTSLPQITKSKYDLFSGNVREPARFLFLYSMFAFLCMIALIASLYGTYLPGTTENTIKQSVCFTGCVVREDEMILFPEEGQIYKVRFIDDQFDPEAVRAICDGRKNVTAYSVEVTPRSQEDYYSVKAIMYDDDYVLTFEETNRLNRQEYDLLVLITVGACLFLVVYVLCAVIVGRNPERFSDRVINFFFKDECVKSSSISAKTKNYGGLKNGKGNH